MVDARKWEGAPKRYISSIELGQVIDGGGVGRVTATNHKNFDVGQLVVVPFTGLVVV